MPTTTRPSPPPWQKWIPTSKITAVGVAGVIYSFGVWLLVNYYETPIGPFEVAATQTWVLFLIGYSITEHRR